MTSATFSVWRGSAGEGKFCKYTTEVSEGMVVLDAIHKIQAEQANDMAVRWNCKAGKCGSCSAEINGIPRLMCMTRLNEIPLDQPLPVNRVFDANRRSRCSFHNEPPGETVTNVSRPLPVTQEIMAQSTRRPSSAW